jgi:single-strand DNA-binding protein
MQKNSLNRVILIGRLGKTPEGRYTPSGIAVASFSLATNESWNNKQGLKEHTEWHNIVAWEKLADFANEYLYKGQLVNIEGLLRTRQWEDKEHKTTKKITEIICTTISPLEWKSEAK